MRFSSRNFAPSDADAFSVSAWITVGPESGVGAEDHALLRPHRDQVQHFEREDGASERIVHPLGVEVGEAPRASAPIHRRRAGAPRVVEIQLVIGQHRDAAALHPGVEAVDVLMAEANPAMMVVVFGEIVRQHLTIEAEERMHVSAAGTVGGHARQQAHQHVGHHGQPADQVELLEDEAHLGAQAADQAKPGPAGGGSPISYWTARISAGGRPFWRPVSFQRG